MTIFTNNGYCRLHLDIRAIISKKRFTSASLFITDKSRNMNIAHGLVIVENLFVLLCTFGLFARKWRWDESKCEMFFKTGIALINNHIIFHGLRASDGTLSTRVHSCLISIGDDIRSKRAVSQANYCANQKRRLSEVFQSQGEKTVSDSNCILIVEQFFDLNASVG